MCIVLLQKYIVDFLQGHFEEQSVMSQNNMAHTPQEHLCRGLNSYDVGELTVIVNIEVLGVSVTFLWKAKCSICTLASCVVSVFAACLQTSKSKQQKTLAISSTWLKVSALSVSAIATKTCWTKQQTQVADEDGTQKVQT